MPRRAFFHPFVAYAEDSGNCEGGPHGANQSISVIRKNFDGVALVACAATIKCFNELVVHAMDWSWVSYPVFPLMVIWQIVKFNYV